MTVRASNAAAKAAIDAATALLGATAVLEIFTGSMPANCEDAATGTKLASLPLSATPFGAAADTNPGARATAGAITTSAGLADGTAGYGRLKTAAGGSCHFQGDVGVQGDVGDFIVLLNTLEIQTGIDVAVTALYITHAETRAEA